MNSVVDADQHPLHASQFNIAEALPEIVWTARADGTVDGVNGEFERYTGISGAGLTVSDWLLGLHPEDREPTLRLWDHAITQTRPFQSEVRLWCAAQERWHRHLVDARPHRDAEGKITRWYGIAVDVQNLRDVEQARDCETRLQSVERRVLEQITAGEPLPRILTDICTGLEGLVEGAVLTVSRVGRYAGVRRIPEGDVQGGFAPVRDVLSDEERRPDAEQGHLIWSLPIFDAAGRTVARLDCHHAAPLEPTGAQSALLQRMAESARIAISHLQDRDRLRASEHRYRSLFDFLPIAVWEEDVTGILTVLDRLRAGGVTDLGSWLDQYPSFAHDLLPELRVLDANRAARQFYDAVDADLETLSRAVRSLADEPTFRTAMRGMLMAVWDGHSEHECTYSVTRPDGSRADILARMLLPEPGTGRLLSADLDITEQRRVEDRFRHVAQASSDYIFDRDFATDQTWVNEAQSWLSDFGDGAADVPRIAWVESVHPDDRPEILRQIDLAIEGGKGSWEGEYRLRQRDGSYIPVLERASILRNDAGEPVRMIGNIINLSERKALEAQLRQSQRLDAVGQLTGGIAHDFNNLLTVILGNAELLAETLPADQPSAAMARQIMFASERAADLTQRLLAFARKQPLSPGTFDANEIVRDMRLLVERVITPAITLVLDLADTSSIVHVDRPLFESALLNLCVNARDAMPAGGVLRVETSARSVAASTDAGVPAGDYVCIAVTDTGHGIDEDTLARVFEPFFTTKPTGHGSGLGLSMVHGFVHQSGGWIGIQSDPGSGTTVELLLPQHDRTANPMDEPEAEPSAPHVARRARILLVEDQEEVREYMCMIVRSLGYEVEAEPLAADALLRLRTGERFDLLLSDIVMPGGVSGRQLAETVLQDQPDLPVLLVSGYSEEIATSDGQLDPRIGFLRKPFRKFELERKLADMLPG